MEQCCCSLHVTYDSSIWVGHDNTLSIPLLIWILQKYKYIYGIPKKPRHCIPIHNNLLQPKISWYGLYPLYKKDIAHIVRIYISMCQIRVRKYLSQCICCHCCCCCCCCAVYVCSLPSHDRSSGMQVSSFAINAHT